MSETLAGVGALLAVDPDHPAGDLPAIAVRLGGADQWLRSGDEYRVWQALSRAPQSIDSLVDSFFRTDQDGQRRSVDPAEVGDVVDQLRDRALVVGITDGEPHLDLAMRLRLQPLWRAVIDTEQVASGGFAIGTATSTQAVLTQPQHDIWASLDGRNRIAQIAVGNAVREGAVDPQPDLVTTWRRCLELVTIRAAYLDVALGQLR